MHAFRSLGPLLAACALLASAHSALAQSSHYYAVEMIVFAYPGGDARYAETWRADPGMPDVSRAFPVSAGVGVAPVSPSAYRLNGIWQALKESRRYQPLRHVAWSQRGLSRNSAPVVLIGEDPGSSVYGTVQVSRQRFLHVDLDLVYQDAEGRYRFRSHRRMRSNEIHFLDHPVFGVLLVVTPLEG